MDNATISNAPQLGVSDEKQLVDELSLASKSIFGVAMLTLFVILLSLHQNKHNISGAIPKGPIGLPILGSFPFLTHYPEKTLDYWAKKFGNLYSLWLGNQLFVIISDPNIAKDLMVTNGANFSSRKPMFIKSQTIMAGRGITVMPYGDRWRKHRRLATNWLTGKAVNEYTHVIDLEATDMVKCLYQASNGGSNLINPQPFAGRLSLNTMLTITFGIRTETVNDPLVQECLRLSREFMNCSGPVSNMIDYVPLLQYLPSKLHARAQALHKDLVGTYGGMIKKMDARMQDGEDVPNCLTRTLLNAKEKEGLDDLDLALLAGAFMIGGVETTASIMQWFSALIPAYPDIQKRAQDELDRVVGRDRLPTLEDEINLPFCHAIIKETERCHNPFWLGTPHVASNDFTYKDKFIPKDTVVICNAYTMHHNKDRYPDPMTFNPDRYINDNLSSAQSAALADPMQRDHWTFGAGRRICPGMIVAEREIFLAISRLLWAFRLEEVPSHPIDLEEYDGLSGRSPVPFKIRLVPRHENVKKVLEASSNSQL